MAQIEQSCFVQAGNLSQEWALDVVVTCDDVFQITSNALPATQMAPNGKEKHIVQRPVWHCWLFSMVENKGALEKEKFASGAQTNMTHPPELAFLPSTLPTTCGASEDLEDRFLFLTFIFFFPSPKI